MSYANTVREFAKAHAKAMVWKTSVPSQYKSYGQTSYMYNKSTNVFRNAIEKLIPSYIEECKKERIAYLQKELAELTGTQQNG